MRLDIYLMEKWGISSRHKAQSYIIRGNVFLDTQAITKPGYQVKPQEEGRIVLRAQDPYVGFGAYKLLCAWEAFELKDKVHSASVLDIGSSTGGFTQILLEKGAQWVYAVDVGENQLDYRLRSDQRVISYEKTDVRKLDRSYFVKGDPVFFTVDVSFISLKHIFPTLNRLDLSSGIALIKPQFEIGKEIANFQGIVKKEEDIQRAIHKVKEYAKEFGYELRGLTPSPTQNTNKNREFLALIGRSLRGEGSMGGLASHRRILTTFWKS